MTPPLNYRDAARMLGIPIGTLRSMVCRRQVPHVRISPRIVVFEVASLTAWVTERRVGVANDAASRVDADDTAA